MADIFDLFRQIGTKKEESHAPVSWIVAGLGNPGKKYEHTRHNAGFLTIDVLAEAYGVRIDRSRFQALTAEATVAGQHVLLLKPQTLMNASGAAVGEAAAFYKIPSGHVLVISDDINLDPGQIRVRRKGSDGGQKGLRDITVCLGTEDFPRIRMGVGKKPHPDFDLADWVLSDFSAPEMKQLLDAAKTVREGVEKILSGDFDGAMQICNSHTPLSGKPDGETSSK